MNRAMFMDIKVIAFSVIALAGVAGLLALGLGGESYEHSDHDEEQYELSERAAVRSLGGPDDILSVEQILHYARQQHVGRVLEIELEEQRGGRLAYEVEILGDSGEVWEMNFDARTGELLEEEKEE